MKEKTSQPRFKFNTVGLFTNDNKATVDFYTKAFGFNTSWDGEQPNVEMFLGNNRTASGDIRRLPLTRTAIIVIIVLYSLRALAGGWACVMDFNWLRCISSITPAFIVWCYYPGLFSKRTCPYFKAGRI